MIRRLCADDISADGPCVKVRLADESYMLLMFHDKAGRPVPEHIPALTNIMRGLVENFVVDAEPLYIDVVARMLEQEFVLMLERLKDNESKNDNT